MMMSDEEKKADFKQQIEGSVVYPPSDGSDEAASVDEVPNPEFVDEAYSEDEVFSPVSGGRSSLFAGGSGDEAASAEGGVAANPEEQPEESQTQGLWSKLASFFKR